MNYYIGVDGGGSKTAICGAFPDGSGFRRAIIGSASWQEHGVETVLRNIKDAIGAMVPADTATGGVAVGLPCYGESADGDAALEQGIRDAFAGCPVMLLNDVVVGWAGSRALEPGINVVSGTGSIAYGRDPLGNEARCGGWNEFFSDEGSCYWIGRKTLELFSKQSDGRLERGPLYEIIRRAFGLDGDMELIDIIRLQYQPDRKQVAGIQRLAREAALAGDASVEALYAQAVRELYMIILGVKNSLQLGEDWAVSYSGGLFQSLDSVARQLSDLLRDVGGVLEKPRFTPEMGALLLAVGQSCPDILPSFRSALARL